MSNEELVRRIQAGERELLMELWEQNQGMIRRWTARYTQLPVDRDDLLQAAFIGFMRAVEAYREDVGVLFMSYAERPIRTAIRRDIGLDGKVRPELNAVSLDEAVAGEDEDLTRLDGLADDTLPDMADIAAQEDMRRIVRETVETLPDVGDRQLLHRRYWEGRTIAAIAGVQGCTKETVRQRHQKLLRQLRRKPAIRRLEDLTQYYRHKGVTAFKSSFTSAVEDTVLWREQWMELHARGNDFETTGQVDDEGAGGRARQGAQAAVRLYYG